MYSSKIRSEQKSMKIKERKTTNKSQFKCDKKILSELSSKKYLQSYSSKRQKRYFSNVYSKNKVVNNLLKESKTSSIKKSKGETFLQKKKAQKKQKENNISKHHFLTVAELQSPEKSQHQQSKGSQVKTYSGQFRNHIYGKENNLKDNPNKQSRQQYGVQVSKRNIPSSQGLQRQLDKEIDKLTSKQNTINILSHTIQTKLIQTAQQLHKQKKYTNRLDAYEVEINFYIDKISQLQKELYEKNMVVKTLTNKNINFETISKDNKKIINENNRLRQEKDILEKENQLLKKIVNKKYQKVL